MDFAGIITPSGEQRSPFPTLRCLLVVLRLPKAKASILLNIYVHATPAAEDTAAMWQGTDHTWPGTHSYIWFCSWASHA